MLAKQLQNYLLNVFIASGDVSHLFKASAAASYSHDIEYSVINDGEKLCDTKNIHQLFNGTYKSTYQLQGSLS